MEVSKSHVYYLTPPVLCGRITRHFKISNLCYTLSVSGYTELLIEKELHRKSVPEVWNGYLKPVFVSQVASTRTSCSTSGLVGSRGTRLSDKLTGCSRALKGYHVLHNVQLTIPTFSPKSVQAGMIKSV